MMMRPSICIFSVLIAAAGCSRGKQTARGPGQFPDPEVDLPRVQGPQRVAVFAGGCFWCVESVFEELGGVSDVVSGYCGGSRETANYSVVSRGKSSHAEAVRVTYDPGPITYGTLLKVFFATHDPTQLNRQGPDVGAHYRSAVFYGNEDEKRVALAYIKQLDRSGLFEDPIVTRLERLGTFYPAEAHHQDYARQNPHELYIQLNAKPKVKKLRKQFPELLRAGQPQDRQPAR